MSKRFFVLALVAMGLGFSSCKKSSPAPVVAPPTTDPVPTTGSRAELTKDSLFLYAKEIYYWNANLPTYSVFNPRQYTSLSTDALNYNKVLFEITKYSAPGEYTVGSTSPKFSYIFDKANQNPVATIDPRASVDLEGNGNDLGFRPAIFLFSNDPGYLFYIGAIYQNSPAEKAGLVRGDIIKKINGVSFGANYTSEITPLNAALGASAASLEVQRVDGTTLTVQINKAVFKSSPIYKNKILTAGSKKIGYVAYARFSNAENSVSELTSIFNGFATNGVTDLIVDLRYNGGGYVSTAEHLINLIAPSTASGVMFSEHFNATMQAGNAKIMANQPLTDAAGKIRFQNGRMLTYADVNYTIAGNTENFAKAGNLTGVQNVVFLVGSGTASASELVINSLKPHMNVKIVGRKTYGKPIGFFPITLENKYEVYFSLFETKNSRGEGGYYDGFTPDDNVSELSTLGTKTNVMFDFGDASDGLVKSALNILAPGIPVTSQGKVMSLNNTVQSSIRVTASEAVTDPGEHEFIGMVENRRRLK